MAKAALEALSLLMYLWFLQFEQKSIRIVKTWKMLLQAIDAKILATFTTKFLNEIYATLLIYNAVSPITSIV